MAEWRKANPERVKELRVKHHVRDRDRNKRLLRQAKARPCHDCGVSYPWYVMQFDHRRGVKAFELSATRTNKTSLARLAAEIDKCDVVCANCHAERTHQDRIAGTQNRRVETIHHPSLFDQLSS